MYAPHSSHSKHTNQAARCNRHNRCTTCTKQLLCCARERQARTAAAATVAASIAGTATVELLGCRCCRAHLHCCQTAAAAIAAAAAEAAAAAATAQSSTITLERKDWPVVASSSRMTMIATIAMRPFQVSALLVQPQDQGSTGAGRVLRSLS